MAAAAADQRPITRELLREWCKQYAPIQLSPEFDAVYMTMEQAIDAFEDPKKAKSGLHDAPHKIDENLWRGREYCEQILALTEDAALLERDTTNIQKVRDDIRECFKGIVDLQEKNMNHARELVQRFLPKDWRGNMAIAYSKRMEQQSADEIRRFEESGGSIEDKYNMLWDMQLKRRQSLVMFGNASGVFKFLIKYIAGVPQVLLDFVKTINDEFGPMEEIRVTYGPTQYRLTEFVNRMFVLMALVRHAKDLSDEVFNTHVTLLVEASAMYRTYLHQSLALLSTLFLNSPMITTAEQSSKQPMTATVTVAARSFFEFALEITDEQVGSVILWEFSTQSKDIGFKMEFAPRPGSSSGTSSPVSRRPSMSLPNTLSRLASLSEGDITSTGSPSATLATRTGSAPASTSSSVSQSSSSLSLSPSPPSPDDASKANLPAPSISVTGPTGTLTEESAGLDDLDLGAIELKFRVERELIVSARRHKADQDSVRGEMKALKCGTYFLCWDNTFSILTSKVLLYSIKVRAPPPGSPMLPLTMNLR